MHNNFYFLRQIATALTPVLTGSVVSECFTQSRDELVLRFEKGHASFFLRASLSPDFSCLSFPREFQRARKNSVDLFPEMAGRRVMGIRQFNNERSFALHLSEGLDLLFKMHGNRTNVILFRQGVVAELFRKKMTTDLALRIEDLDRHIDWTQEYFLLHRDHLKGVYFTFGKVVWNYLEVRDFFAMDADAQWFMLRDVVSSLENPRYYLTIFNGKPVLSLLETGAVKEVIDDPLTAANEFFHTFTQQYALFRERAQLLLLLRGRIGAGENYCRKNEARLASLQPGGQYRLWADLIMANLHAIPPAAETVVLESFYEPQKLVTIPLKKDESPQKNAENFYRKAKNQHIEIERLQESVRRKRDELAGLSRQIQEVEAISDLKTLRALRASLGPQDDERSARESLPYREFHYNGFRIWVGKNAQSNDVLTFKFGRKDDLWLHARDVSGSHVLIKHQAGKNYPKDVIEYAASLAASHSKRKTESLCPVTVTPKKFVRKRKGDPPGAVVVDRETVVYAIKGSS